MIKQTSPTEWEADVDGGSGYNVTVFTEALPEGICIGSEVIPWDDLDRARVLILGDGGLSAAGLVTVSEHQRILSNSLRQKQKEIEIGKLEIERLRAQYCRVMSEK